MALGTLTDLLESKSQNHYKLANFLLLIVVFFYLEYIYVNVISVIYSYEGYVYNYDLLRSCFAKIIVSCSLLFLQLKFISPFIYTISILIKILFLFPNLILFEYMHADYRISLSVILLDYAIIIGSLIKINISVPMIKEQHRIPILLSLSTIMLLPFFYTFGFNLNLNVLLLQDIYDVRIAAREQKNMLTGYFYSWVSMIIIPIIMVICISKKKTLAVFFCIIALLYLYLTDAQKTLFFGIFIIIFFYFNSSYYKKTAIYLSLLVAGLSIARFLSMVYNLIIVESMLVDRVFFLPSLLNIFYFDFFDNKPIYLAHSVLGRFVDNIYAQEPDFIIGKVYIHSDIVRANNGIISDGFMNFGMLGTIGEIIIVALLFAFFNSLNISHKLFGIFLLMVFYLYSGPLLTNFLTNGIFLTVGISLFMLRDNNLSDNK